MGMLRVAVAAAAMVIIAGTAPAQECEDFNPCTGNDMCSEGVCTGAFQDETCDDGDPCTGGDRCELIEGFPVCRGTQPGQEGATCGGGCGTCEALVPIPGSPLFCIGEQANNGDPCDAGIDNPCVAGRCQIFPGTNNALCFPEITECPDTDGDLCNDICNFETGECEGDAIKCDPNCESCNAESGACEPANLGNACDDFNVCTPESRCETIGEPVNRTFCLPGDATGPTPTPTGVPTACVGDCDDSGNVAINELITGVNISLGNAQISQCLAFDTNDSGEVEINELIGGVNSSLNGCA